MAILNLDPSADSFFYLLLILFQLAVVLVLAFVIRARRNARRVFNHRQTELRKQWILELTSYALGDAAAQAGLVPMTSREKRWLKHVMIEITGSLTGPSLLAIRSLYKKLGFLEQDHRELKSFFFARKLKALSFIDIIDDAESVPHVRGFMDNRNYYLRFSAFRFLARRDLDLIKNFDHELELLKRRGRYDTILEVLTLMALNKTSTFVEKFRGEKDVEIRKIYLKVISDLKLIEPLADVRGSLKSVVKSGGTDLGLIKQHLLCLSLVGDTESEELCEELSKNASVDIRYLALCTLFILRPDMKERVFQSLSSFEKEGIETAFESFSLSPGRAVYG